MEHKYIQEDEITLKELIEKGKSYFFEIMRNWKIILLSCIIFGAFFYLNESRKTPVYTANLSFNLLENESYSIPGSSVLDLMGFSIGSNTNANKIIETIRSNLFLKLFLSQKMNYQGRDDFIANHLIRVEKFNEQWKKNELISEDFYFTEMDSSFTLIENSILKNLTGFLVFSESKIALQSSFNEENELISISFESREAEFAVEFCNLFFDFLSEYFLSNMIIKQQQTIDIIENRRDSFEMVLKSKEFQLANYFDSFRNTYVKKDKLPQLRLERDVRMLQSAYAQTAQNYEIALFNLENSQAIIQAIDRPFLPLRYHSAVLKQLIIGLILGGFIAVSLIVLRKIFRDAMA
jgi:hypothetical protein